jgi:hypothetical protein
MIERGRDPVFAEAAAWPPPVKQTLAPPGASRVQSAPKKNPKVYLRMKLEPREP